VIDTTAAESGDTTASDEVAAELKALELEKEKAEAEAEQAKLAAQKETKEVQRAAARQARKRAAQAQKAKAAKAAAKADAAEEEAEAEAEESSAPPNVVGLPLPAAKSALKSAGYTTAAVNTDTLFGIVNEDNYTICRQDPPRGTVVKVLAQKYGC
jgi:ATPase subunit of ABC transporter with duplicated ATPase domains